MSGGKHITRIVTGATVRSVDMIELDVSLHLICMPGVLDVRERGCVLWN